MYKNFLKYLLINLLVKLHLKSYFRVNLNKDSKFIIQDLTNDSTDAVFETLKLNITGTGTSTIIP